MVVFYAGHCVETGCVRYLLPVDTVVRDKEELRYVALTRHDLTAAVSRVRKGALVIVDACRDNPFVAAKTIGKSRGPARPSNDPIAERMRMGLAASPTPADNNIVLHPTPPHPTQPGSTAGDGDAMDSPFFIILLQTLSAPGPTLDEVVAQTAKRDADIMDGSQRSAAYGETATVLILPLSKQICWL